MKYIFLVKELPIDIKMSIIFLLYNVLKKNRKKKHSNANFWVGKCYDPVKFECDCN